MSWRDSFAMGGDGAHGVRQVHLHDQVVQDLHTHYTVLHRALHSIDIIIIIHSHKAAGSEK